MAAASGAGSGNFGLLFVPKWLAGRRQSEAPVSKKQMRQGDAQAGPHQAAFSRYSRLHFPEKWSKNTLGARSSMVRASGS
jgi:hypothetical protein